jgi:hypothetical protein
VKIASLCLCSNLSSFKFIVYVLRVAQYQDIILLSVKQSLNFTISRESSTNLKLS